MNSKIIDKLVRETHKFRSQVYGIGVYENGEMKTVKTAPSNDCNAIYSICKNFTAVAVGILIDRGLLTLDTDVYSIFENDYENLNQQWKKVKVRHVLSQTTGIVNGFLDIDSDDIYKYPTDDFLKIVLEWPLKREPEEFFLYSDSHFYLASRIVSKVSGMELCDFLTKNLFTPLKFQGYAFARCPKGYSIGGSGLYLRVEDLLKFGVMCLNLGEFEGKRIVSEKFMREAMSKVTIAHNKQPYGYSFWLDREGKYIEMDGIHGQSVYIYPEKKVVAAWLSYDIDGVTGQLHQTLREIMK
ncbi:MAG: serine hydrolase [Ruminococcaceae bacterium]|nr:serine hydrolase [Oscillospiraceae bacterium]